ncbi:MAG: hypothetical protein ACREYE_30155 [Gammaproteobacteria bacterium]
MIFQNVARDQESRNDKEYVNTDEAAGKQSLVDVKQDAESTAMARKPSMSERCVL